MKKQFFFIMVFILTSNMFGASTHTLHDACREGKIEKVKALIAQGIDVDTKDENGVTALHRAVFWQHAHIVEFLLEEGADINVQDNEGRTPLHEAVWWECFEMVELLIDLGADLNVKNNSRKTPLLMAVIKGSIGHKGPNPEIVQLLNKRSIKK